MSTRKEVKHDKTLCKPNKNTTPGVMLYGDRERGDYAGKDDGYARMQAYSA